MTTPSIRWDRETLAVAGLALLLSLVSFLIYFRRGEILLYGDAVAHINIARRVFDSRTPGLLQLGTVWLPLPHLLMIPFLIPSWMWRTGVGGSIPSMIAYVLAVAGIFRLLRNALGPREGSEKNAGPAAWFGTLIFAANPSLIYLQATAMTESLYLAFFVWTAVFLCEFARQLTLADLARARGVLLRCGLCLAGAMLTRYDGWFLGTVVVGAVVVLSWRAGRGWTPKDATQLRRSLRDFLLLAAAIPVLWMAYNAVVYRNPMEFATGPYSAHAIERRSSATSHPGTNNLPVALLYFVKSAATNLAREDWQRVWLVLALAGSLLALTVHRRLWPLLLLGAPIPFYMLSVAYGGVPIYVPAWWPATLYNLRYGLQLLPAVSVFAAVFLHSFLARERRPALRRAGVLASFLFLAVSYAGVWGSGPVCFREAWINSRTRLALESQLAEKLKQLPPHSSILMYLGDHAGAAQQAGIPLRRVIQEGNHRTWKQPSDSEGLWERALADPKAMADYAVGFGMDPVALAAERHQLEAITVIEVPGQPRATLYQSGSGPR
jgi:hypothetical protein